MITYADRYPILESLIGRLSQEHNAQAEIKTKEFPYVHSLTWKQKKQRLTLSMFNSVQVTALQPARGGITIATVQEYIRKEEQGSVS